MQIRCEKAIGPQRAILDFGFVVAPPRVRSPPPDVSSPSSSPPTLPRRALGTSVCDRLGFCRRSAISRPEVLADRAGHKCRSPLSASAPPSDARHRLLSRAPCNVIILRAASSPPLSSSAPHRPFQPLLMQYLLNEHHAQSPANSSNEPNLLVRRVLEGIDRTYSAFPSFEFFISKSRVP